MSLLHTIKEQEQKFLSEIEKIDDIYYSSQDGYDATKDFLVSKENTLFREETYPETIWELDPERVKSFHRTSLIAIFEENIKRLQGLKKEPTPQQISAIEKYGNGHTYNQGAFDAHNNTIEDEIRYYQHLLEGLREE